MLHELLRQHKLVLASASPRRKEVFDMLGLNALIVPAKVDEPIDHRPPWVLVKAHSSAKAAEVAKYFDCHTVIVGADTLVFVNKTVLGKPADPEEAAQYLNLLSGKEHTVYSGVTVLWQNRQVTGYAKSLVTFQSLSEADITAYIRTKEPLDKAGAYGIQGFGSQFISKINGCYFNVMGFPVNLFYRLINDLLG
jgi:septum formation protein